MTPLRTGLVRFVLPLAFVALLPAQSANANTTIGLYSDVNGGSCSFSGNAQGPLTAYVVVKPDPSGVSGVRFAVEAPSCLGATFVSELTPDYALSIGSSDTGISVAFTFCATEPTLALTINYYRTNTTPCCEFSIAPDPYVSRIEAADCAFTEFEISSATSRFNADATCPCNDGRPPYPPHSPDPADYTTWVLTNTALSWSYSQYDGDIVSSDVYFGTTTTPPLVTTVMTPTYQPPAELSSLTQYYWRVVLHDTEGMSTSGPLWRFTTRANNSPPSAPQSPSPASGATNVTGTTLSWLCSDPDGDAVRYFLYFGTVSPPPLVASLLNFATYNAGTLTSNTQYYWRVVARDSYGAEASGPTWTFSTGTFVAHFPNPPTPVSPANGVVNVGVNSDLTWNCSDPDGDALTYAVYFGLSSPPPLVASDVAVKVFDPGTMPFNTAHYWKVVARDPAGHETAGPIWNFATALNSPPTITNPSPPNGAADVSITPTLGWTSTDEYPGSTFDVYFGTTSPPPLAAASLTTTSYLPGTLAVETPYYWRVVARDVQGMTRTGTIWSFVTVVNPTPSNPSPQDNTYAPVPLTLRWNTNDSGTHPILCDLYFGTQNPPPLLASAIGASSGYTTFSFAAPDDLVSGTRYYWRVYSYSPLGGHTGPVWSFVAGRPGDVNLDGSVTLADASCALQIALNNSACAVVGASPLADVNCEIGVTPRDALCIHKRAIGQACPFCGEAAASGALTAPVVSRSSWSQSGNTMTFRLAVSGVASLEAFKFGVQKPANVTLVSVLGLGPTADYTALQFFNTGSMSYVGGYTLEPAGAVTTTEFIELRFQLGGTLLNTITVTSYADDLAGAQNLVLASGGGKGGGGLPVLFTRFSAAAEDGAVRVAWEFTHDNTLDGYTIFRGTGGATPSLAVMEGPARVSGSYLDRNVEPGALYRYEMVVRDAAGDEYRSPIATVQLGGPGLSLGANHPNPFNPQTIIPYSVPPGSTPVRVRLAIYDTSGRLVRTLVDEDQSGGAREVVWRGEDGDGKPVTSGVYFCVLHVEKEQRTRKLVLLK